MDLDANIQLSKTYNKKQQFYDSMQKNQKSFSKLQQKIFYLSSQNINSELIIKLPSISEQRKTFIFTRQTKYIINAQFQPQGETGLEKFLQQFIHNIPRPAQNYGLIYINTLADSSAFGQFKKILSELPIEYLLNLTKIHVVEPSFLDWAVSWFQFCTNASFINNKIVSVNNIRQLSKLVHLELDFLYKILPRNIVHYFLKSQGYYLKDQKIQEINPLLPSAKQTMRNSWRNEKFIKVSEEGLRNNYYSGQDAFYKQLSDYECSPEGTPLIFQMLINLFISHEEWLKQQGIFRKSVSIDDQKQLSLQVNKENYRYISQVTDPHLLANAIKKFVYNLRNPIIPFQLFEEIMSQENQNKLNKIIIERIRALPNVNRMTIFLLFDFLKNKVAPYSQYNKMGQSNLSIVFGPCLMKSPQPGSLKELIYAKKIIVATSIILKQFKVIFGDKTILPSIGRKQLFQQKALNNEHMLNEIKIRRSRKIENSQIQYEGQEYSEKMCY